MAYGVHAGTAVLGNNDWQKTMTTLNNRKLTIVLVALVVVYLGVRMVRVPQREGTLAFALGDIDAASVSEIKLYPRAANGSELVFTRSAGGWQVAHDGVTASADSNAVKGLLASFLALEGNRVVTEQAAKWDEYKVGDTTGTHVVVLGKNDDTLGEWWVGEAPGQGSVYGGGQSYVRKANDDKVYSVDGYLYSQYNKGFASWRNQSFLRLAESSIAGATASGIRSWRLERDSTVWLVDGEKVDSAAVARYIRRFASMNFAEFADGFVADKPADALLTIHGAQGDLASIQAWRTSDSTWTVQSSYRPEVYFKVDDEKFDAEIVPTVSAWSEN